MDYSHGSPSAFSRRAVVSYWRKYVHEVLVNRLGGLSLPRKSVIRLTDHPDMTLDVYRGRKTTMQQQQQQRQPWILLTGFHSIFIICHVYCSVVVTSPKHTLMAYRVPLYIYNMPCVL